MEKIWQQESYWIKFIGCAFITWDVGFYMHCMNMQMKTAVLVLVTLNVVFFHGMFCRKNRNTLVILVYYFCLMHRQLKKILRFI